MTPDGVGDRRAEQDSPVPLGHQRQDRNRVKEGVHGVDQLRRRDYILSPQPLGSKAHEVIGKPDCPSPAAGRDACGDG